MDTKICSRCKEELPLSEFYPRKDRSSVYWLCKKCTSKKNTEVRRNAGPRAGVKHNAKKHGLDVAEVLAYYDVHDGMCDICKLPPAFGKGRLSIDHDHETGRFRGLLCDHCNVGLSHFKDSVLVMKNAITYLQKGNSN